MLMCFICILGRSVCVAAQWERSGIDESMNLWAGWLKSEESPIPIQGKVWHPILHPENKTMRLR